MRVLFSLPGLHRYNRGAELAFISIASELAKAGEDVTLVGSGPEREMTPYRYLRAASIRRERFGALSVNSLLADECSYEELTYVPNFLRRYRPADYDVTIGCSYPFSNWALRRPVIGGVRPPMYMLQKTAIGPRLSPNPNIGFLDARDWSAPIPNFMSGTRIGGTVASFRMVLIANVFRRGFPPRRFWSPRRPINRPYG